MVYFHIAMNMMHSIKDNQYSIMITSCIVIFNVRHKKRISKDIQIRTGSLLLSRMTTIVAVMMLNFCVRYGYRCLHHAITTGSS